MNTSALAPRSATKLALATACALLVMLALSSQAHAFSWGVTQFKAPLLKTGTLKIAPSSVDKAPPSSTGFDGVDGES